VSQQDSARQGGNRQQQRLAAHTSLVVVARGMFSGSIPARQECKLVPSFTLTDLGYLSHTKENLIGYLLWHYVACGPLSFFFRSFSFSSFRLEFSSNPN
jgi:hypothetical protein